MTENNIDQQCQQTTNDSIQQSTQQPPDTDIDMRNIKLEEIEEWDVVWPEQRKPQFRYNENFGRRIY